MLNLAPPFLAANTALVEAADFATNSALPTVVFVMQRDVLTSYRYALQHYLLTDLDAANLQNSSLGTPYEKWAKFTNDDFERLSFSIGNMLRYTGRLVEDTICRKRMTEHNYSEMKQLSNAFIDPIVGLRAGRKYVGVRCEGDSSVTVESLASQQWPVPDGGARVKTYHIGSRPERDQYLRAIHRDGSTELQALELLHDDFVGLSKAYNAAHEIIFAEDGMHPSWLI